MSQSNTTTVLGVISDTHGLVRPEAVTALKRTDLILHAGDIGNLQVLEILTDLAPVIAVRGNNDKDTWADNLPHSQATKVGAIKIYMIHDLKEMNLDPLSEGFRVVVSGHSHKPVIQERNGVIYLNPGSAGPRRFSLPISLARLQIKGDMVKAELVNLMKN